MTIHKLTKPGSRRTICGLNVPEIIRLGANAETWNDGDGSIVGLCFDGCHPRLKALDEAPAPTGGWPDELVLVAPKPSRGFSAIGTPFDRAMRPAPAPGAPRPAGLQRFNAMANLPHSGPTIVGDAIVNRDGTINVSLTLMPGDGKLRLVPA